MRGAVARALVVLGLCSSFLITSLSSRPCVCALILVSLSLVCVCVCVLGQPASRSPRRRTPTRRRSSSATPPPASVRPRPRATASTSTATTAPGACSSPPSSSFPPIFEIPFCTVASLLRHSHTPCLFVCSSWDNRKITSIPSSISLLKDLMTLFVFSLPFSSLLSASNTDAHNAQRARRKQSHLAPHRCHELTPRADVHVCLSFPSPHHALPCGVHRARLATDTCAATT